MNWQWLSATDRGISYGIAGHITVRCPWLRPLDDWLVLLADRYILLAAVTLAAALLWLRGGALRSAALLLLVPLPLALALTWSVKVIVHRPRFQDVLVNPKPQGFTFPSGSALATAAVYGSIGLLAGRRLHGLPRKTVYAAAFLLPFVVGVSRLFVLNHYLSDVFAGWGAGAAIALLCRGIDGWLDRDAGKERAVPPLPDDGRAPRFVEGLASEGVVTGREGVQSQGVS